MGSTDLVNSQYFMKWEGTYLQLLENKSQGENSKSWKQKLSYKLHNMKIHGTYAHNGNLDLFLMPDNSKIVVIQQTKARPFSLEGGEGICIIEKIPIKEWMLNANKNQKKLAEEEQEQLEKQRLAQLEAESD